MRRGPGLTEARLALHSDSFSDLAARVATGTVIVIIGLGAIWLGGWWFTLLAVAVVAGLIWELVTILGGDRDKGLILGAAAAVALLGAKLLPAGLALPLVLLVAILGIGILNRNRTLYVVLTAFIMLAAFGLMFHRDTFGFTWMLWLVLVVAATDILGYFAGRIIGGPKFWPKVSPKKTWSGTVAGWVGAALVGWAFLAATGSGVELVGISVALSMAAQMGDIIESAVKRRMGVKDSSALLPGHGGLWDRFDGVLGAAFVLVIVESVVAFPPAPL